MDATLTAEVNVSFYERHRSFGGHGHAQQNERGLSFLPASSKFRYKEPCVSILVRAWRTKVKQALLSLLQRGASVPSRRYFARVLWLRLLIGVGGLHFADACHVAVGGDFKDW